MDARSLLAIDVGSRQVVCAIGRPTFLTGGPLNGHPVPQGVELLGCGVASYPESSVGTCDPAVMAKTIEQALDDTTLSQIPDCAQVSLTHPALSHQAVSASIDLAAEPIPIRRLAIERLTAQALSQALALDQDVLLLEPLGYAGNGFEAVRDPRGLIASRLTGTFNLIAVPVSLRRAVRQALDMVGLELGRVVWRLQAIAAASMERSAPAPSLLLVDLGDDWTDLAIIRRRALVRSLTIPEGRKGLADAIAQECRLTVDQAFTLSCEGTGVRNAKAHRLIERYLHRLEQRLQPLLKGQPLPERALITGSGALMDGVVEWVEGATTIKSALGRSRLAKSCGTLVRQIACTPAIGLLELVSQPAPPRPPLPSRFVARLLAHTKSILTEYF